MYPCSRGKKSTCMSINLWVVCSSSGMMVIMQHCFFVARCWLWCFLQKRKSLQLGSESLRPACPPSNCVTALQRRDLKKNIWLSFACACVRGECLLESKTLQNATNFSFIYFSNKLDASLGPGWLSLLLFSSDTQVQITEQSQMFVSIQDKRRFRSSLEMLCDVNCVPNHTSISKFHNRLQVCCAVCLQPPA